MNTTTPTLRHFIGKLHETNGERQYVHMHLFKIKAGEDPQEYLENVAARFYGDGHKSGDGYDFEGGEVFVQAGLCREVTLEFYRQYQEIKSSGMPQAQAAKEDEVVKLQTALAATQNTLSQAMQYVEKANRFVQRVANLSMWDCDTPDGTPRNECEEPCNGYLDSHSCLMELIEDAREILGGDIS